MELIDDTNFDITEAITRFLLKRERSLPPEAYHADCLYLYAYRIHQAARCGEIDDEAIAQFKKSARVILAHCHEHPLASNAPCSVVIRVGNDQNFVTRATEILHSFATHIPHERFRWYIISGTFLGLHRKGGFLSHDIDLDFGIDAEALDLDALIEALKQIPDMAIKNITNISMLERENGTITYREKPGIIKLLYTTRIQIDLFIHHLQDGMRVHGSKIHM